MDAQVENCACSFVLRALHCDDPKICTLCHSTASTAAITDGATYLYTDVISKVAEPAARALS